MCVLSWAWQPQLLPLLVLGQEKAALNQEYWLTAPWRLGAHDWRKGGLPYCPIFFPANPSKTCLDLRFCAVYSLLNMNTKIAVVTLLKKKRLYL